VNRFWINDEIMVISRIEKFFLVISLALLGQLLHAQEKQKIFDFMTSEDYVVGGVSISGIRFLDTNALIGISGLRIGQEITVPGDVLRTAVQKLWQQGLFSDIRITISKVVSDSVFLDIFLQERPRIS
jgi:outer membrane protein insertion porin family